MTDQSTPSTDTTPSETTPPIDGAVTPPVTPPVDGVLAPVEAAPAEPVAEPAPKIPLTLSLPENSPLDAGYLAKFTEAAEKAGLSQDDATAQLALVTEAITAKEQAQQAAYDKVQEDWKAAVFALPDMAPSKREATEATLARFLEDTAGPDAKEIREVLGMTGAGNNPAIVRWAISLSKQLTEGTQSTAPRPLANNRPKTRAEILYPTQAQ